MSDQLADSAHRLFDQQVDKAVLKAAENGSFPQQLWDAVVDAGFTLALLPEGAGGFGASVAEALHLLQIAAEHTAPIPLAETMLAGWLLARAALPIPDGVLTLAPVRSADSLTLSRRGEGWHLAGTATRIPWGRDAAHLAVLAAGPDGPMLASIAVAGLVTVRDVNLAGEPRDDLTFNVDLPAEAVASIDLDPAALQAAGAAVRTAQLAGALSRILALSVTYAQTRVQFGRPIGKFQAIQQNLAVLAGQSAAAIAAADMAADALAGTLSPLVIGAAKARAGEAASIGAALAHQSHGAIGFTQEYDLHYATRRLWSWRDEFGDEAAWNAVVGRIALAAGPDGLWPALTAA